MVRQNSAQLCNQELTDWRVPLSPWLDISHVLDLRALSRHHRSYFLYTSHTPCENLALRQHLAVFKRRHPRPKLHLLDKLLWVAAHRFWSGWKQSLVLVTPETVVQWHRASRAVVPKSCLGLHQRAVVYLAAAVAQDLDPDRSASDVIPLCWRLLN